MRCMVRNLRPVWYCLYYGQEDAVDDSGYYTGDIIDRYSEPILLYANVSPATGFTQAQPFGNLADYDKVLVTDQVSCPISEDSVLFVDKEPDFKNGVPVYDYRVRRVSRSLNSVSIAISKVDVS